MERTGDANGGAKVSILLRHAQHSPQELVELLICTGKVKVESGKIGRLVVAKIWRFGDVAEGVKIAAG